MKFEFLGLLLVSLALALVPAQAAPTTKNVLQLGVPSDLRVQGEASNENLEVFDCVLKQLDWPYSIILFPWKRGIEELKHGRVDAIIMATPSDELEVVAEMSSPFALEKWYWFYQKNSAQASLPINAVRLGVVSSSHTEIWLEQQGLRAEVKVNSTEQLLNMLLAGRIDTFLADEELIQEQLKKINQPDKALHKVFSHYISLGVYFSSEYLHKYPVFMTGFNNNLKACNTKKWQLTFEERAEIKRDAIKLQQQFSKINEVAGWLTQANQAFKADSATGAQLDELWATQVAAGSGKLLNSIELHPLSQWLRLWQAESKGLISEAYVTGLKGFNVAESQPLTDFDQSDEAEYQAVILSDEPLFINEIEYDESSQRFQVKVAWPIKDLGKKIGMVVIGINIESALRD